MPRHPEKGMLGRRCPEVGKTYNRATAPPACVTGPAAVVAEGRTRKRVQIRSSYRALAFCQQLWQSARMAWTPQSEEGRELRDALEAERRIARMDVCEDLARLAETETIRDQRDRLRARYCALIGVRPEDRSALRQALHDVADGTAQWMDAVAPLLNGTGHGNGSADPDADAAVSSVSSSD